MKAYRKMPIVTFGQYQLRTIQKNDYQDMYAYGQDEETVRYLSWGPMHSPDEAKKAIRYIFYPRLKRELPVGYAIVDTKNKQMIGTIDFHTKSTKGNGAELGFVLHRDYWNQGIMTQAVIAMIELGFTYLNYDKIVVKHLVENKASAAVIKKTGFRFTGKEPFSLPRKKITEPVLYVYELTKEEYLNEL